MYPLISRNCTHFHKLSYMESVSKSNKNYIGPEKWDIVTKEAFELKLISQADM